MTKYSHQSSTNASGLTMATLLDVTTVQDLTVEPGDIALGVFLSLFAIVTIFGNCLVIVAVLRERHLRSSTNYLIVSLAVADLVIGAVVMPFAITLEVMQQRWMFGRDWCDVWHSFDVLASTASILNLSGIALDRYLAITNAIKYPQRMTTQRIVIVIAVVWIMSAAISFPAILWWRVVSNTTPPSPPLPSFNVTSFLLFTTESTPDIDSTINLVYNVTQNGADVTLVDRCVFTEDPVYLVVSSIVSFYFPVVIILYAYYRIYKAASAQTRSIKNGSKVLINCSDIKGSDGRRRTTLTLRIHRGGAGQRRRGAAGSVQESSSRRVRDKNNFLRHADRCDPDLIEHYVSDCEYEQTSQPCLVTSTVNGHDTGDVIETMRHPKQTRLQHPSRLNTMTSHSRMYQQVPTESPVPTSDNPSPRNASRGWQQKFAISRKLGKIAKEQKAAKTLGIVMGIFCICWVPFFITNVLYAICKTNCVARPDILFPIFTWLGYINSGMNPVIYACSMRDFRRAFYKILCRSCPKQLSLSAPRKNHNTTRKTASHTRNGKCVRFNDVTPQSDRYLAEMTSTYASEMTSATATSSEITNGLSRLTSSANGCDSS